MPNTIPITTRIRLTTLPTPRILPKERRRNLNPLPSTPLIAFSPPIFIPLPSTSTTPLTPPRAHLRPINQRLLPEPRTILKLILRLPEPRANRRLDIRRPRPTERVLAPGPLVVVVLVVCGVRGEESWEGLCYECLCAWKACADYGHVAFDCGPGCCADVVVWVG